MDKIVNKVAESKLVTIDLEDFYPSGNRITLDIKNWLFEGLILREKDFREYLKNHNWQQYQGAYVALYCGSDAIIPGWAYMLVTTYLTPFAKKTVVGTPEMLETILFSEIINQQDFSVYSQLPVIVKGCSQRVPQNAYTLLVQKLQPYAKSIMYGEACSTVPLHKKKSP